MTFWVCAVYVFVAANVLSVGATLWLSNEGYSQKIRGARLTLLSGVWPLLALYALYVFFAAVWRDSVWTLRRRDDS